MILFRRFRRITRRNYFQRFLVMIAFFTTSIYIINKSLSNIANNNEEEPVSEKLHKVREYIMYNDLFSGELKSLQSDSKICLSIHATIDHLYHLVPILKNWDGPVSLAVYAPDTDWPTAIAILNYMRRCIPAVRELVDVHFVYKSNFPPVQNGTSIQNSCADVTNVVKKLGSLRNKKYESYCPQNLLRNTARLNCKTPYVMALDIDITPSVGMFGELEKFLNELKESPSEKNVYVIPSFEMDKNEKFPMSKKELLQLIQAKTALPIYFGIATAFQGRTEYDRWYNLLETDKVISAYKVNYTGRDNVYEPFYVARYDHPLFDDTFEGHGTDRGMQVYELLLAGYNFYVLDPVFLMHRSLHTLTGFNLPRLLEHLANIPRQDIIKEKLRVKYNQTWSFWEYVSKYSG